MFKKILKALFLSDKRKRQRHFQSNLQNILFLSHGKAFQLSNLSDKGLAILNSFNISFNKNEIFEAELEFDMAERVHLKVKVARVKNHEIGLEILQSSKNFREQLSKISN
jgi:hypothetical protein